MIAFAQLLLASSLATSAAEVSDAMRHNATNVSFDLTAKVTTNWENFPYFSVEDDSGAVILSKDSSSVHLSVQPGDLISVQGNIGPIGRMFATARYTSIKTISRQTPVAPTPISFEQFNCGAFDARFVRMRGTVTDAFRDELDPAWIYLVLSKDNDIVYVAFAPINNRQFEVESLRGCEIVISGVCNPDEGGARHHAGRMLIAQNETAFEVISRPSWWTPKKLVAVFCVLLVALCAAILWSISLRIIAERRSHELFREKIAHVSAELKADERARLSAELHDSIAQSLTGVALQINAAKRLASTNKDAMLRMLDLSAMALQSCRAELRNCLWDLRNQALDEPDIENAIRQTLLPHLNGTKISVKFNVPRRKLSDNTTHALLRIIRELVSNAIVHGHASQIWIAGNLDKGQLMFSVKDNGSGFVPETIPSTLQGHFGLQGIKERIRKFAGTLAIDSALGKGSKITIALS